MKSRTVSLITFAATLFISAGVALHFLGGWISQRMALQLEPSLPGMDGGPPEAERGASAELNVDLTGTLTSFDGVPSDLPGHWPRFRGPDSDNIVKGAVTLAESWPETGPEIYWSVELGEGHAAPAVHNGCVYLFDYDEKQRADALRCFSLADGREIWRRAYPLPAKRNHGLSRTIPAVTDDYIVTIGPRCHVSCVDAQTGAFRWGIDLQKEFGTTEPLWFTGQCPLIENGRAILAPAGSEVLMMAVDCESGEVAWSVPNPNGWKMSHSSVMPVTLHGQSMFLYAAVGGMTAVSPDGDVLWELSWNASVVAPSPLVIGEDRVFIAAGYGAGSQMIGVEKTADGFAARELARSGPKEWLASEQQTPILYDGLLYGIMPKDAGALKQQLVCYDPDGGLRWSSGKTVRFGLGPFLLVNEKFFVLDDDGTLSLFAFNNEGCNRLAQHRVLDGHDAWGPLALAGTRLLLRDSTRMVCIEVGE